MRPGAAIDRREGARAGDTVAKGRLAKPEAGAAAAPASAAPPAEAMPRRRAPTIDVRSLVFDPIWYLERYPDVAAQNLDPVQHYLGSGADEGRDPNPFFQTTYYCASNPDVVSSGMNPFLHYLLYGAREGRPPRA